MQTSATVHRASRRRSPCAAISIDPTLYRPYDPMLQNCMRSRHNQYTDRDLALAGPEAAGAGKIRERVL